MWQGLLLPQEKCANLTFKLAHIKLAHIISAPKVPSTGSGRLKTMNGIAHHQSRRETATFDRMRALDDEQLALFEELRGDDIWAGSEAVKRNRPNWGRRFETFRTKILLKDSNTLPTAQDIRDFIIKWAMIARSSNYRNVLRFNTVCYAVRLLREYLAQKHGDFSFDYAQSSHIRGSIEKLEEMGLNSREALVHRKPIGVMLIRQLVLIMIRNAIWNGTRSWSFEMQDIAIVVIMASLNARAGDIVQPKEYSPVVAAPYLVYGDIELVVQGEDVASIKGRWKMRNCKGEKIHPTKWFRTYRNALPDGVDSIMCPVRLLLILALRSGNVYETSVKALLQRAKNHQSKAIEWVNSSLPIFAKRDGKNPSFLKEQAAEYRFVWDVLRRASLVVGSSHAIRPHDIRGGAAVDLLTVATQLHSNALPLVANELNHSDASRQSGITRHYTRAYSTQDQSQRRG